VHEKTLSVRRMRKESVFSGKHTYRIPFVAAGILA